MGTTVTGSSVNDGITLQNLYNTVTQKPDTHSINATITTVGGGFVFGLDRFVSVNFAGGNDTLVAINAPYIFESTIEFSRIGYSTVDMGSGNDSVDFNLSAVRTISLGSGDDFAAFKTSGASSLDAGTGNDHVRVDFSQTTPNDLNNPDKVGQAQTYNGNSGNDTLDLVGLWSLTLASGTFALDTNNNGIADLTVNSITSSQIGMIITQPSLLSGTVRWPVSVSTSAGTVGAQITFQNFETIRAVCFVAGCTVETDKGPVLIEHLHIGDKVITRHGPQAVKWIGKRHMDRIDLMANIKMMPVRVPAGALGENHPQRDVLLSPQHRVVVRSEIAKRMFDEPEVLVPVKCLIGTNGIDTDTGLTEITYYHIMLDRHEVVQVEGIEAETLFPGPQMSESLSKDALDELHQIFPELDHLMDPNHRPAFILPLVQGRDARALAARHSKTRLPLY